jgi:hypothetical protein
MRRGDAPGTLSQRLGLEIPRQMSRSVPAEKATGARAGADQNSCGAWYLASGESRRDANNLGEFWGGWDGLTGHTESSGERIPCSGRCSPAAVRY